MRGVFIAPLAHLYYCRKCAIIARVAQSVERFHGKEKVAGSIPASGLITQLTKHEPYNTTRKICFALRATCIVIHHATTKFNKTSVQQLQAHQLLVAKKQKESPAKN